MSDGESDVLAALKLAETAISTLDEDVFGWGDDGHDRWPLRDEILSKLRAAIEKAEGQ